MGVRACVRVFSVFVCAHVSFVCVCLVCVSLVYVCLVCVSLVYVRVKCVCVSIVCVSLACVCVSCVYVSLPDHLSPSSQVQAGVVSFSGCKSPVPNSDIHVYECQWENCGYQFEELGDLIDHINQTSDSGSHCQVR